MRTTRSGVLSVCTLALGAMLGFAPAASAAGVTPPQITCPDKGAGVFAEADYVTAHGEKKHEYTADNGTAMVVWEVDGHYEIFGTNGFAMGRACYSTDPGKPPHVTPSETGTLLTGGGGGGDRSRSGVGAGNTPGGVGIGVIVTWRDVPWRVRVA